MNLGAIPQFFSILIGPFIWCVAPIGFKVLSNMSPNAVANTIYSTFGVSWFVLETSTAMMAIKPTFVGKPGQNHIGNALTPFPLRNSSRSLKML